MSATGPQSAGSGRLVAVLAAVVAAAVGLTAWLVIAVVGAVDRAADRPSMQMMIRAVPASYEPVAQAAAVAQTVPVRMGDWTPQRGIRIAERALRWLNMPYSFGGGGEDGPSYGVAVDYDSRNDDHVYGFDCSGLTMYATAPWLDLHHDAATQYTEVGSYHPSINSLQPGDFVFWSSDGTIAGIGHVAIYLGDGMVVQAPQSGDVIRVTPVYEVEAGTMGATRPLT